MNLRSTLPLLTISTALLLGGCAPSNVVTDDGIYLVYQVADEGQATTTRPRYVCYVRRSEADNSRSSYYCYTLLTNTRYSVGDRVVITRVPLSDEAKVEGSGQGKQ